MHIITLTKHMTKSSSGPAPVGDGAPEFKSSLSSHSSSLSRVSARSIISVSMVDAGVSILWASGVVEGQLGSDRLLVSEIFEAMASAPDCE